MPDWYHSFTLPNAEPIHGVVPEDDLRLRFERYQIPTDLSGMRALDIGAWDGWFSFEMERRGAEVVAIDNFRNPNFLKIHRLLNSSVAYQVLDVHRLNPTLFGQFDIVLFLGVLYHLKHPLLALQNVCSVSRNLTIVESYVDDDLHTSSPGAPLLRFIEGAELRGHLDNWYAPNTECLLAMCRTAGFVGVTEVDRRESRVAVHCHRKWRSSAQGSGPPRRALTLIGARHYRNGGINVSTSNDDYVSVWIKASSEAEATAIQVTIGGFAAPVVWTDKGTADWQFNVMLPPGIPPGWQGVKVAFPDSEESEAFPIAVDIPPNPADLTLVDVCHPETWRSGHASGLSGSYVCMFASGLPENADHATLRASWGDVEIEVDFVGPLRPDGLRQVNGRLTAALTPGPHPFVLECGPALSAPLQVVSGDRQDDVNG